MHLEDMKMKAMHAEIGDTVRFSKTVGETDVYMFAGITGDFSGNHVNEEFMKKSKYGRRIAHGALLAFILAAALMVALGLAGALPLAAFVALSMIVFFAFSMVMPNFGALALEPLGAVAGTAASTQGFMQMVLGSAIGTVIGQFFDGTAVPLAIGFFGLALMARLFVTVAGRHRGADTAGLPASPPLH